VRRYADAQSGAPRHHQSPITSSLPRSTRAMPAPRSPTEALLRERDAVFNQGLRRHWALKPGELNNVTIATDMTYSRHYPYLERVFDALGP